MLIMLCYIMLYHVYQFYHVYALIPVNIAIIIQIQIIRTTIMITIDKIIKTVINESLRIPRRRQAINSISVPRKIEFYVCFIGLA